jgi:hypothetical protein
MTETFPASMLYLGERPEHTFCFEFGALEIRICFGFRASTFVFAAHAFKRPGISMLLQSR